MSRACRGQHPGPPSEKLRGVFTVAHLGPASPISDVIAAAGDTVFRTEDPITPDLKADWLVSYGYRHIIPQPVLDAFPNRAINLHISMLPWNRGADPNLWSIIDGTPRGVTIHYLDAGIDTGPIIGQRKVQFADDDTLATSYQRLKAAIEELFAEWWPTIREGRAPGHPHIGGGTYHRSSDKASVEHLLTDGWDTPVAVLAAK